MGQEIVYCLRCQTRIVGGDFERGEAYRVGEQSACSKCAMEMLPTVPLAVQEQILEQKRRVKDAREKKSSSPKLAAQPRGPTGSSTQVRSTGAPAGSSKAPLALLAGIGVTLVILVGMLVMSGHPPQTPAAPVVNRPPPPPSGPAPREIAAQGAFQVATAFAKDHPADYGEQARLFEKIVADYAGTPACADAKRELEAIARRRKEAVDGERLDLLARAREMGVREEYQKAVELLEARRKNHAEQEWTRPIDDKVKEFGDAMASQFPGLRDRAVDARKRDAASELHLVRATVAKWGSASYADQLEKAIGQVFPPITAKDNGNFLLRVAEASVNGSRLKRTGEGDWCITQNWGDPKDWVEWTIAPKQAGTYTIKLNYASPKEFKGTPFGGDVFITVGGETRTFTLESTKGWGDYATFTYGTIPLTAGVCKVTVRGAKIITGLMSLRFVQLAPAK